MQSQNYTTTLLVDQAPKEVFNAINDVRGWWKEDAKGSSQHLNEEFSVRFGDIHYSVQRLTEVIPDKKVVWLVTESDISFVKDKSEWTGTEISFEISRKDNKTQMRFEHKGLVPTIECYSDCASVWNDFIHHSLLNLITTGKGKPDISESKQESLKQ